MKQHLLGIGLAMTLMAAGPEVSPEILLPGMWPPPKHLEPEGVDNPMIVPAGVPPTVLVAHARAKLRAMQRLFEPVLDESARVFMQNEHSLWDSGHFVVGLKQTHQGFKIFGARPMPRSKAKPLALDQCEAPIDTALARRVIAAWDAVVLQRKPRAGFSWLGSGMMDGSVQHFSSRLKGGVVTGHLYVPERPWNPGWLSLIAVNLDTICHKEPNQSAEPWAELRHALGQINLKSQERVPYRPG